MKIELNQDWTEFLSVLISRHVRFLLVGGHAVAAHAEARLTSGRAKDLFDVGLIEAHARDKPR